MTSSSETRNNNSTSFSIILYDLDGFQLKFSISDLFISILESVKFSNSESEISSLLNSTTPDFMY